MFHADLRGLGSNNFWNSSYKEKTAGSVSVSRLSSVSYDYGNKKLNPIVTELFIRGRKLNISLAIITKSYFPVPNSTHCFIIKIPNKRELQQTVFNHHQILTLNTL